MTTETQPKLAPPGAGLPLQQWLFARFYLGPFVSKRAQWAESRSLFEKFHGDLWKMTESLSEEQMRRKVLVPPLPGLEDSSRFWSPAMVLEHLVIVGQKMEMGIISLSHGHKPGLTVDVAAVKPLGAMSVAESRAQFRDFYSGASSRIEKQVGDWSSSTTLHHPWFGPMNARQWAWLLGTHGMIHRRQMRAILGTAS